MSDKTRNFSDLMESMMVLAKQLKVKSDLSETIPFEYEGLDITIPDITATFPNIKERFSEKWVEYFNEKRYEDEYSPLHMFIQSCFHLGFQQGVEHQSETTNFYKNMMESWKSYYVELEKSNEWIELKLENGKYINSPEFDKPVIAMVQHFEGNRNVYSVLKHVDESDCDWRVVDDNSELSYSWNVIKYKYIND